MTEDLAMAVKLTPFQETVMITLYEALHRGLYPDDVQLAIALEADVEDVRKALHILELLGFVERADG